MSGTTWFCIPRDDNVILFGSSILVPRETSGGKEEIYKKEPKELYIDAARTLPERSWSLLSRARSVAVSVSLSLHRIYSKYLLLSTYNKIISEDNLDKRKPEIPF